MNARRGWGVLFVPLYRLGLIVAEKLRGKPKELEWPVVSVGSLSAGGAGKTPVVIALAKLLVEAGWGVDVLSRGYGRSGRGVELVRLAEQEAGSFAALRNDSQKSKGNSNAETLVPFGDDKPGGGAAERFGDEPVLIAEKAEVGVWVGADRLAAGRAAEGVAVERQEAGSSAALRNDSQKSKRNDNGKHDHSEGGGDAGESGDHTASSSTPQRRVHLLDDGFQHRQLGRAMDVVLVTAEDLVDGLLPAGNLREPVEALRRADVVVVREDEFEAVGKRVWALLREGAQMWTVRRRLAFPAPTFVFGAGLRPVAFCAIARPEGFAAMLLEAGCGIVETVAFADHHRYEMKDVDRVAEVAKTMGGSGFVTTEKDAVKLSAAMRRRLEQVGPLMVVALEAEFADGAAVVRAIEAKVTAAKARGAA